MNPDTIFFIKQNIHTQTFNTNFRRMSPFGPAPVKKSHKARTRWYPLLNPSVDLSILDLKKKILKKKRTEWTEGTQI